MGYLYQPHSWIPCARLNRKWTILLTAAVLQAAGATLSVQAAYQAPASSTNPPANYYANATGTGSALRMSLHNIISAGFVQQSYTAAETALTDTDKDPNNPNDILTIYDRTSLSNVWNPNASTGWNREHQWPASRINGATSGPTADLFELRPAAEATNGGRGNLPYGGGASASGGPFVDSGKTYFFPGDADKGDVSRAMFYMATMYYTGSSTLSSTNLQLINGYTIGGLPDYKMGDLASMLAWNYQDNVDTFERNRNQQIYNNTGHPSLSQKNRNPYVDHPEYVWAVWGDRLNNSQISVGTPAADGSSTANISLGRIMANGTFGTSTATFAKTGYTPTTFDITTGGNATIPNAVASSNLLVNGSAPAGYLIAGTGQGIDFNSQTRQIVVGLNASTSATGLKSGTITIHNTDLTTAAAGQGAADGNDTINVTGSVLAKRSVASTGSVNFGTVITGANVAGNVTLSTTGDDNNFTRVTVAGSAASDANGVAISGSSTLFNAANVTATRTVGGTLTSVGNKSGTLSLAVVTAENGGSGISGEGTYAPLNIGYSATVLGHATPSFSTTVNSGNLTLNFPTVAYNAAAPSQGFSVANIVAASAAGLDFTGYTVTGDTAFATNLATFQNEAQGASHGFIATLTTSSLGTFSTTYTLNFSDEQDLPGATTTGPLTLTLTGSVGLPGDANLDGTIDLNDLNTVLNNLGGTTSAWSAGNFDGASTIDLNDLNTVLNNLGTGAAPTIAAGVAEAHALLGAAATPEPASLSLLAASVPLILARRRRRM